MKILKDLGLYRVRYVPSVAVIRRFRKTPLPESTAYNDWLSGIYSSLILYCIRN